MSVSKINPLSYWEITICRPGHPRQLTNNSVFTMKACQQLGALMAGISKPPISKSSLSIKWFHQLSCNKQNGVLRTSFCHTTTIYKIDRKLYRVAPLITDNFRCNSTNRQNSPIHQLRRKNSLSTRSHVNWLRILLSARDCKGFQLNWTPCIT